MSTLRAPEVSTTNGWRGRQWTTATFCGNHGIMGRVRRLGFIFAVLSVLGMTGCGGAHCTPQFAYSSIQGPVKEFMGSAKGPNAGSTERAALADALTRGLQTLGVRVQGQIRVTRKADCLKAGGTRQQCVTRMSIGDSTSVSVAPIEVRDFEEAYCYDGDSAHMRSLVRVPASEWNRLVRVRRGGTVLVLDCAPQLACTDVVLAAVRQAVQASGILVHQVINPSSPGQSGDLSWLLETGLSNGAGYVLSVSLQSRRQDEAEGVLYGVTDITARLIETSDGQELRSWTPVTPTKPFEVGLLRNRGWAAVFKMSMLRAIHGHRREQGLASGITQWGSAVKR